MRAHTCFEFNPVFDKHQKSGTFYYELPWAATVVIKIQKWTSEGPKPTDNNWLCRPNRYKSHVASRGHRRASLH